MAKKKYKSTRVDVAIRSIHEQHKIVRSSGMAEVEELTTRKGGKSITPKLPTLARNVLSSVALEPVSTNSTPHTFTDEVSRLEKKEQSDRENRLALKRDNAPMFLEELEKVAVIAANMKERHGKRSRAKGYYPYPRQDVLVNNIRPEFGNRVYDKPVFDSAPKTSFVEKSDGSFQLKKVRTNYKQGHRTEISKPLTDVVDPVLLDQLAEIRKARKKAAKAAKKAKALGI